MFPINQTIISRQTPQQKLIFTNSARSESEDSFQIKVGSSDRSFCDVQYIQMKWIIKKKEKKKENKIVKGLEELGFVIRMWIGWR